MVLNDIIDAILKLLNPTMSQEEVIRRLDARAATVGEALDWRNSIVDLLKLLELDSSLHERKALAHELGYTGESENTDDMNLWLQQEVLKEVATYDIKIPT